MPDVNVTELLERVPDWLLVAWLIWGALGLLLKLASSSHRHRVAEAALTKEVEQFTSQSQSQFFELLREIRGLEKKLDHSDLESKRN